MTSTSPTSDSWYLDADEYYVAAEDATEYPVRQGDLFPPPRKRDQGLARMPTRSSDMRASEGEREGSAGHTRRATGFLPPYKADGEPMFSNFREIATLAKEHFTQGKRLAALTHDARVTFIRRAIYWDYRHFLSFEEVRSLEAARISSDSAFKGPRPSWAPAAH